MPDALQPTPPPIFGEGQPETAAICVLKALLTNNDIIPRVRDRLRRDRMFYMHHDMIFGAILDLAAEGCAADIITVDQRLKGRTTYEAGGGRQYLLDIISDPVITVFVDDYVEAIIEGWARRELQQLAVEESAAVAEPGANVAAVAREFSEKRTAVLAELVPPSAAAPHRLAAAAWLERDISAPDFLLGHWLSTTSRAILTAASGLGKTNFAMAIAFAIAEGEPFLHWAGSGRRRSVLYIDGEMSSRLLRARIDDAARRIGRVPERLFFLSRDDHEGMPPLNLPQGQTYVDRVIEAIGDVEFIFFDNVMSLIAGDMREEAPWADTLTWAKSLTRRRIGQAWVHHSGHDETRSYGTSTRIWQLDTSLQMERIDGDAADIAFTLTFKKARERTPENRADFCDVAIRLTDDAWNAEPTERRATAKPPSPKGQAFHRALVDAVVAGGVRRSESAGRPSATMTQWRDECVRLGLLDGDGGNRSRAVLSKYRQELVATAWAACNGDLAWSLKEAA